MRLTVNKNKCPQDHRCPAVSLCQKGAISQKDIYSLPLIDGDKCILCGDCIKFCPKKAFETEE